MSVFPVSRPASLETLIVVRSSDTCEPSQTRSRSGFSSVELESTAAVVGCDPVRTAIRQCADSVRCEVPRWVWIVFVLSVVIAISLAARQLLVRSTGSLHMRKPPFSPTRTDPMPSWNVRHSSDEDGASVTERYINNSVRLSLRELEELGCVPPGGDNRQTWPYSTGAGRWIVRIQATWVGSDAFSSTGTGTVMLALAPAPYVVILTVAHAVYGSGLNPGAPARYADKMQLQFLTSSGTATSQQMNNDLTNGCAWFASYEWQEDTAVPKSSTDGYDWGFLLCNPGQVRGVAWPGGGYGLLADGTANSQFEGLPASSAGYPGPPFSSNDVWLTTGTVSVDTTYPNIIVLVGMSVSEGQSGSPVWSQSSRTTPISICCSP